MTRGVVTAVLLATAAVIVDAAIPLGNPIDATQVEFRSQARDANIPDELIHQIEQHYNDFAFYQDHPAAQILSLVDSMSEFPVLESSSDRPDESWMMFFSYRNETNTKRVVSDRYLSLQYTGLGNTYEFDTVDIAFKINNEHCTDTRGYVIHHDELQTTDSIGVVRVGNRMRVS